MKVLWIALVWPEPGSSAAGFRTMQLLNALCNAGYDVEVCSPCKPNHHQERLEKLGIKTASYKPNDSSFDKYVKELDPRIVFFDRFMAEEQFGWRVKEQVPLALRVLDTVDLHSLRRARHKKIAEFASLNDFAVDEVDLASNDAIREISSIFRSDLSLIISDAELALLKSYYKISAELLELNRFHYTAPVKSRSFEERKHFVAIGNFNHEPNADSYRMLHAYLWNEIREQLADRGIFDVELHIYGAYPTKEFTSLDNPETGFRVKGWATDAMQTLGQYRVNLAPLRFGAGIKGKVSDGWAVGTPCVGTEVAKEGMCQDLAFGGAIADNKEDFIKKAVSLYRDELRWSTARDNGLEIIKTLYNEEKSTQSFLIAIRNALVEREQRRLNNFVGQMLWHHQHRSTEFFSRWIEAKNAPVASAAL
jgi:hypothetical protein